MTTLANYFKMLNVSNYEYDWNKLQRLQVRRVAIQMFLNGDTFESLEECSRYLFSEFRATPSFVHPFLPCLQYGYNKEKYWADVILPEYASLLAANKEDFLTKSMIHIQQGKKLDSILYATLMRPKVRFDTNSIDMLSTVDVIALQQQPNTKIVSAPKLVGKKDQKTKPLFDIAPVLVSAPEPVLLPVPEAVRNETNSKDFEELTINVLYLKDKIDALISEQHATQKMLQEFMDMQVNANWMAQNNANPVTPTLVSAPKKRNKVLVVGMWPRQFESLRLSFAPEFWDHFDISYISSDIIRKDKLENSGAYDQVFINTTAINHTMEQIVRANCEDFIRYTGGVSALRTLILSKAKSCEFGSIVRDNINNWILN